VIEFRLDRGSGVMHPGDRLPTAREVVAQLAINPNTVHKAYRELERDGLVASRPGQGTFVQRSLGAPAPADAARLSRSLAAWVGTARAAGLDQDAILALADNVVRASFAEGVA
jgi:GntR family transcriptional regulator